MTGKRLGSSREAPGMRAGGIWEALDGALGSRGEAIQAHSGSEIAKRKRDTLKGPA